MRAVSVIIGMAKNVYRKIILSMIIKFVIQIIESRKFTFTIAWCISRMLVC